jgi:hypothetical protein
MNVARMMIMTAMCMFLSFQTVDAQEYIKSEQLQSSTVDVLPGTIPTNYVRERDPENMVANAVSKISGLFSSNTGLTLGMVGGIGALGLIGVVSAPVAAIGAAVVGGLALMGSSSGSDIALYNQSKINGDYGYYRSGAPSVYGANYQNTRGVMSNVFGWSRNDQTTYQLGSLGVASSNRAPVYTNMTMPNTGQLMQYGYGMMDYDSGYSNAYMPMSASSSFDSDSTNGPASAGNSYVTYYDNRGSNTFSNFFQRTDNASVVNSTPNVMNTPASSVSYYQPQVYYNWNNGNKGSTNYLAQSWEYQGVNSWNSAAPQGRINQPVGAAYTAASGYFQGFTGPNQYYDMNAAVSYPYGNAYSSMVLPNNYNVSFMGNNAMYQGYNTSPLLANSLQQYSMYPQIAPGITAGNYTNTYTNTVGQAGQMAPVEQNVQVPSVTYGNYTVGTAGSYAPVETNLQSASVVIDEQAQAEAAEEAQGSVNDNSLSATAGAMAPTSKIAALEERRTEVYKALIDAMRQGDDSTRKQLFEEYQNISKELVELKTQ